MEFLLLYTGEIGLIAGLTTIAQVGGSVLHRFFISDRKISKFQVPSTLLETAKYRDRLHGKVEPNDEYFEIATDWLVRAEELMSLVRKKVQSRYLLALCVVVFHLFFVSIDFDTPWTHGRVESFDLIVQGMVLTYLGIEMRKRFGLTERELTLFSNYRQLFPLVYARDVQASIDEHNWFFYKILSGDHLEPSKLSELLASFEPRARDNKV